MDSIAHSAPISPASRRLDTPARGLDALMRSVLLIGGVAALWFVIADGLLAGLGYVLTKSGTSAAVTAAYAAGHVLGLGLVVLVWRSAAFRQRAKGPLARVLIALEPFNGVLILVGIQSALRLAWILLVPTEPTSDSLTYHQLATRLAEQGVYGSPTLRAYWPPGYPSFLGGLYFLFGSVPLVAKVANIVLAGLTDMLVWKVVRTHVHARAAALAVLLTAAWPWRTLHVDVLSYDALVVVLILASMALIPLRDQTAGTSRSPDTSATGGRRYARWIAAGVVLGFACLVRSTLGVLPLVVGGWLLVRGVRLRRAVLCAAVYGVSMLLPLVPWSIRNYLVFDTFVPLTTNAGGNFYMSWAPGSDGGVHKPAWVTLKAATGGDEPKLTPLGFRLGTEAIWEDWGRAARIVLQKQVHYLGSDNWLLPVESYIAAFGERTLPGTLVKLGGHTLSNGWFVFMLCLPLLAVRRPGRIFAEHPLAWLCLGIFLTGLVIHTVFLSQARYHLIYLPFWSIMLALLLSVRTTSGRAETEAPQLR